MKLAPFAMSNVQIALHGEGRLEVNVLQADGSDDFPGSTQAVDKLPMKRYIYIIHTRYRLFEWMKFR